MIRQTTSGLWVIDGDKWISAWVEEKGQLQHDFQTLPLILPLIKEGDMVVDAGANIGDTCGPFLERVGATGKVYAFEPMPAAFQCLVKNCRDAVCYQAALGASTGTHTLVQAANKGASYLIAFTGKDEVETITLDSFKLDKLDFLKIDVEGFEVHVLQGAEKTIERCHPIMLIEVNEAALRRQNTNPLDLFCWIHNHKYHWWPVVGADLNQGSPQYDVLCRPIT